ncbi:flagellar hook capping FlgD N-terminal domain-containing protein [Modestobacter sp. NPDC049651]|uniref:flagellar hook assembly protein FlgD n=1 Tax=unclassified Modestobacter TaxID=2643866 RepID=UPI0033F3FF1E
MTDPISFNLPAGATYGSSPTADRPDQMGKDTFLKLLVAQMKYQDPSNPADSSQMMSQTAVFSQVEKLETLAKQNASLLAMQQSQSAVALVGQTVSYTQTDGTTKSGVVQAVKLSSSDGTIQTVIGGVDVDMARITLVGSSA